MTAEQKWLNHKRECRRCQRQWRHWEDGEMTCQEGVDLFFAAKNTELALFEVER